MKILVTGSAGFIGSSLIKDLLARGDEVVGIDNLNDYYDPQIKLDRLNQFNDHDLFTHIKGDIVDSDLLEKCFENNNFDSVVNLAAQAGVRYSIENPRAYIDSNIVGFLNILECCRNFKINHLVYASSSSVYGANELMPFSVNHNVDHPLSLYAASKKSNELMAHTYSELYSLPTTGLRFFTVYGPWGRPDMALFKFTKSIFEGEEIEIFNFGKHKRDFTYIDDIVNGIIKVIEKPPQKNPNWTGLKPDPGSSRAPWKVYNIGNNSPVELEEFIKAIEDSIGLKAKKNFLPLQPGDVPDTYADISALEKDFNYRPNTSIYEGINKFIDWYRDYYRV
tara:strand:- start:13164 stop:14171 length:1008 start_codon:yes stop_codon:yes gene_type:complete